MASKAGTKAKTVANATNGNPVQLVGAFAATTIAPPPAPKKTTGALIARWARIPTPTVFDTMEKMGLATDAVLALDIRSLVPGATLAGPAYTLRWARDPRMPREWNPPGLGRISTYFDKITPGDIVVVDGAGDRSCGHWGEMLSMMARSYGAQGVVVDGGTRDSLGIKNIPDWAAFARYATPIEGNARMRIHEVQCPLRLDGELDFGCIVTPGDWIVADDDSVMRVPADRMPEILKACEALEDLEVASRRELLAGEDVDDVFRKYGRG